MGTTEDEIFAALEAQDGDRVKKAIQSGFDKKAKNKDGESLVEVACLQREFLAAHDLIKAGAPQAISPAVAKKLDAKAKPGKYCAIDDALYYDLEDVALALITGGVAPGAKGNEGNTPLHRAAFQGSANAIVELINRKVDVEALNDKGWTPLFVAVARGQLIATKLLLDAGANPVPPSKTKEGETILDLAAKKPKILALLHTVPTSKPKKKK
jgi:ankyrin repeat protein